VVPELRAAKQVRADAIGCTVRLKSAIYLGRAAGFSPSCGFDVTPVNYGSGDPVTRSGPSGVRP
jgi:hypothetical protein